VKIRQPKKLIIVKDWTPHRERERERVIEERSSAEDQATQKPTIVKED
jgi:hypothetical protein